MYRVALIPGSLRKASTNTGLLRYIVQLNHPSFEFKWIDTNFPLFNEDIEQQGKGIPPLVRLARDVVYDSDAILFSVPENNFSMSTPTKNAIDWLSRKYPNSGKDQISPLAQKIVGQVSSGGSKGGERAQKHLKDSTLFSKVKLFEPSPQATVQVQRFSGSYFDEEGNVVNEDLKKKLSLFLEGFEHFIKTNKV